MSSRCSQGRGIAVAVRLKKTDVVIIGLGAAGGVAALPLAEAGLGVVGLEAGDWFTRQDFAPDEALEQLPRLARHPNEGEQRDPGSPPGTRRRRTLRGEASTR